MKTVVILAGGVGSRMQIYSDIIHKALLPINNKAAITHIIEAMGEDSEFIISVNYKAQQIIDYISIAHENLNVKYIYDVENEHSPGEALYNCKDFLQKPFHCITCDTIVPKHFNLDHSGFIRAQDNYDYNWIGVGWREDHENYCTVEHDYEYVLKTHNKIKFDWPKGNDIEAFSGYMYIHDYTQFFESLLGNKELFHGWKNIKTKIVNLRDLWIDIGTYDKYKQYASTFSSFDFSKTNEFFYHVNGKIIKFFDKEIVEKKSQKFKDNILFPEIKYIKENFFGYDYIPGNTLYKQSNAFVFKKLLDALDKNLWNSKINANETDFKNACYKFYHDKTYERLNLFKEKYPDHIDAKYINGVKVKNMKTLLDAIPWDVLSVGVPAFIHGDLQFDNIIKDENKKFVLLDWRQDFAGLSYGDLYYDLAKLLGGIRLNYDYIKDGLFEYSEIDGIVNFNFAVRHTKEVFEDILFDFSKKKWMDGYHLNLIVGLIYLNMAPLHVTPFDKLLYALAQESLNSDILIYND